MARTLVMFLSMLVFVSGCNSTPAMTSTATVERLEGNQFLVSIVVRRGPDTIATPKVLCLGGERATIELTDSRESLTIDVRPPAAGCGPVTINVRLVEPGRTPVTQRLEVGWQAPSEA